MQKTIITAVLVLVFAGFVFALDVADYIPLGIGNSWTFRDSTRDTSGTGFVIDTTVSQIIDTTTMMGYLTYIYYDDDGEFDYEDTSYQQLRSDGLYMLNRFDEEGAFFPMRVIPNPFNIGDEWEVFSMDTSWSEGMATIYINMVFNGKAVAIENVSVPAGVFNNCVKLQLVAVQEVVAVMGSDTMFADSGLAMQNEMWAAPHVGQVKFHELHIESDGLEKDTTEEYSVLLSYDLSGVDEIRNNLPTDIALEAYPNPFNSSVSISAPTGAAMEIFDINGKNIANLPVGANLVFAQPQGDHKDRPYETVWTPDESLNSGVYLVRATLGEQTVAKRIVYLK